MEQNLALIMLDVKKLSRNALNQKSGWWAGVRPGFFLAGFLVFFAGMLLLRYSTTVRPQRKCLNNDNAVRALRVAAVALAPLVLGASFYGEPTPDQPYQLDTGLGDRTEHIYWTMGFCTAQTAQRKSGMSDTNFAATPDILSSPSRTSSPNPAPSAPLSQPPPPTIVNKTVTKTRFVYGLSL